MMTGHICLPVAEYQERVKRAASLVGQRRPVVRAVVPLRTGATKVGEYSYAGWSIFMAASIIFSNLWGLLLKEWKGVDAKTRMSLWLGIAALVVSVVMIGVGDGLARAALRSFQSPPCYNKKGSGV